VIPELRAIKVLLGMKGFKATKVAKVKWEAKDHRVRKATKEMLVILGFKATKVW